MKITIGDSKELIKNVSYRSIDLILTDVPYDFDETEKAYYHAYFGELIKESGQVIVFSPPENQWVLPAKQYGFWIKPISTKNTSRRYSRFVEMLFFYYHADIKEITWNSDRHWSQYTNVFTEIVDDASIHPYRKPPALIERIIRNHTNVGDLVFDPFCGSGVVGEVCNRTGRRFFGYEKSKKYLDHYESIGISVTENVK